MELIPILSFIILVATISTFILAVGAYILYKVRESRGRTGKVVEPAAVAAELVAPTPLADATGTQTGMRRTLFEEQPTRATNYEQQRQPSYYATQETREQRQYGPPVTQQTPTYAETGRYQRTPAPPSRSTFESTRGKFMRYTSEGYITPNSEEKKPDQKKTEETLRWR